MNTQKVNFLILVLLKEILGVADRGLYLIRNVEDGLCITGGPILDDDSVSIFQAGILVATNCTGNYNQQWLFRVKENKNKVMKYGIASLNSIDLNKNLNLTVNGEFIRYFPHLMEIPLVDSTISQGTKANFLFDTKTGKCFESMGENHVILVAECGSNNGTLSQLWSFSIVNQAVAAGTICNSFWSCNH